YDEHYPEHSDDAFSHKMNGALSNTYDALEVPSRDRANTGVSSTGSGLHYDHNAVASTTALSPTYEQPETLEQQAVPSGATTQAVNIFRKRLERPPVEASDDYDQQGASDHSIRFADGPGERTEDEDELGGDEDLAIKRKKMEDLRHKLKRAVIKA
ncbi:hypothetical protein LPJ71_008724, partial [Coemansia sp. S17]